MPKRTARKAAQAVETEQPVEKHTKLRALFDELTKDREKIEARAKPHRDAREKLLAKILPLEAELREVNAKIKEVEQPHLGEIDMQRSALARAMGARVMSEGSRESAEA